jgi:hypothetical protein
LSNTDLLCAGFLRHFKALLLATIVLAAIRLVVMPAGTITYSDDHDNSKSSSDYVPSQDFFSKNSHHVHPTDSDDDSVSRNSREESESQSIDENAPMEIRLRSNSVDASPKPSKASTDPQSSSHDEPSQSDDTTIDDLLQSYNASLYPLIPDGPTDEILQVHLIVDVTSESAIVEPSSKFLLDGTERSKYLQAVGVTFIRPLPPLGTMEIHPRNHSLPFLYLIDFGSLNRDCHRLQLVMETLQREYEEQAKEAGVIANDNTYTLLADFTGSTRQTYCEFLVQDGTHQKDSQVRLAKRSIVQGRHYDHDTKAVNLGSVARNQWKQDGRAPVMHSPLVVREAFITSTQNVTKGQKVQEMDRPMDVGMFWTNGDYSHFGFYRRDTAKVIKTLHHSKITERTLMENQVGLSYTDIKGFGSGNIQFQYVRDLLSCKIVVVTQRDEYEDHYRLMESLASGALVMTDKMLAMPAGLVDKVNVIVYDSPAELKKLVRYYLQPENEKERRRIALEGFKLVMGRHRCWHRLEELIFGQPMTSVYKPYELAPKKEERSDSMYWIAADEGATGPFL